MRKAGNLACLATLLVLAAAQTLTAEARKGQPIVWEFDGGLSVLVKGQTYDFRPRYTTIAPIDYYYAWWVTPTLEPLFGAHSGSSIGHTQAFATYTFEHQIHVPADLEPGIYQGIFGFAVCANQQSGSPRDVIPALLHLTFIVVDEAP